MCHVNLTGFFKVGILLLFVATHSPESLCLVEQGILLFLHLIARSVKTLHLVIFYFYIKLALEIYILLEVSIGVCRDVVDLIESLSDHLLAELIGSLESVRVCGASSLMESRAHDTREQDEDHDQHEWSHLLEQKLAFALRSLTSVLPLLLSGLLSSHLWLMTKEHEVEEILR